MAASSESVSRILTATTSMSNRSFLGRSLTRRDTSDSTKNGQEAPKGPLGLTTLFEPDVQAVADLIFVHGLNGGSRSTWSKVSDGAFWPQDWLSSDDAFHDVRIHTFGYSSGLNRESVLNIQDFASNLLACVHHCPVVASNTSGPILFVGHSMGGLVIKKAYILARQGLEYNNLADRIRAIFFLATPHQGAGVAQLLSRVLALAPGSRPFVNDLLPQSGMLQTINEEFPRYCQELQLFSFYETQPMHYGVGKGLIVEKHCAVMNYPNERRTYLDANHRDVARFATPGEPSYILVRNALATTIDSQRAALRPEARGLDHVELEALSKFLGISGAPEDDLITNESQKLLGSCQWLIEKDSFEQWRDALTSKVFWLRGRPGAGKSVLASHVINHLRALNLDCCYFFFTNGDNGKTTINSLLRSMAWQMAVMHPEAFTTISNVANSWKDPPIDKVDHIPVWRRIFANAISKVRLKKPQYWVIDALDECKNGLELMTFLRKVQEMWPLCILVTSRTGVDTYLNSTNPSMEVISETILEDNRSDIASFLSANLHHLPGATTSAQQDIFDRILQNSRGCFLWVSLVLRELRQVHTAAEINQVLASNPSDMDALYARILDEMSQAKFGKDLAKAILTWATCAFRPLSVEEIHFAIERDIQDSIDDIEKSISTCSNLVFIDKAKKVQLVHLTAREFLTRKDISSEFIIDRAVSHKRLALVCIRTLCGGQGNLRKGSKHRRLASDSTSNTDSVLYNYASTYLFQHVLQVKSTDNEIFIELAKFLSSREVLVWIEHLAKQSDLQRLYQAGKNCTSLVTRRAHQTPPIGIQKQLLLVERWGIDLVRLVNKFGKRLNQFPSSIHYLIPPFCPYESAFRKQFVNAYRGLNVQGCVSKNWDDCLCTINYPRLSKPMDIASSGKRTALALTNGTILIYDNATLLETNTLQHPEPVWSIAFSENGSLFASGGAKTVRVWNLDSSEQVISFRVPAVCMAITFIEDDEMLLIAAKNNSIIYWDIPNDVPRGEPIDWTRDLLENDPQLYARRPTIAAFSAEQNLLAVIYRGEDILLWTLEGEQVYDMYEKENGSCRYESTKLADGSTTVWAVAFSSTLENNLLVAAYSDGDVVIYDTDTGERRGSLDGINAQTMACSPDGRTLATADSQGNISLFDLRTLKFIYRLRFDIDAVRTKKLAFTSDNLRLLDIRGTQLSVWDPTVLLRQEFEDENSDTISCSTIAPEVEYDAVEGVAVTAMACVRDVSRVICGREDGTVHIYNTASEPHAQELFTQTRNCAITLLEFDEKSNVLSCGDASGRVTSRKLVREAQGRWVSDDVLLFDKRNVSSITQIVTSVQHGRLLVSTHVVDALWSLVDTSAVDYVACVEGNPKKSWLASPMIEDLLIRVDKAAATFYSWDSLTALRSVELSLLDNTPLSIESIVPLQHPQYFVTVQAPSQDKPTSGRVYHLWDLRDFISQPGLPPTGQPGKIHPVLDFGQLGVKVETVVGVANERAVFLDPDNWICSADIIVPWSIPGTTTIAATATATATATPPVTSTAVRHFFMPDDWVSLVNTVLVDVQQSGEIVFAKRADLAVIRRGLEVTDKGVSNSRRLSSTRSIARRPADKRHITV
ncbi:hypothetical protein ANO14919_121960 [Xylariales sp. No.14919]|nr:hypothetical protein ANO14919_121960 [Xylariales sp. No.14919]